MKLFRVSHRILPGPGGAQSQVWSGVAQGEPGELCVAVLFGGGGGVDWRAALQPGVNVGGVSVA